MRRSTRTSTATPISPAAAARHEAVGDIGAQHIERAMGEIDDARDAENDGEPAGDEKERRRRGEAGQELDEDEAQAKSRAPSRSDPAAPLLAMRSPENGAAPPVMSRRRRSRRAQSAGRIFLISALLGRYLAPSA